MAVQGMAVQGMAVQGIAVQAIGVQIGVQAATGESAPRRPKYLAVQGIAVRGIAVQGIAVQGIAVQGIAVQAATGGDRRKSAGDRPSYLEHNKNPLVQALFGDQNLNWKLN